MKKTAAYWKLKNQNALYKIVLDLIEGLAIMVAAVFLPSVSSGNRQKLY